MIFQQKDEVRTGRKTLTQRVDDGGYTVERDADDEIVKVYKNGRLKWAVGKSYAAIPKRGQKRFGDYRAKRIQYRPLHDMTEADAVKEGVEDLAAYRALWTRINGKRKGKRWDDNPAVFAIEFEYLGDVTA